MSSSSDVLLTDRIDTTLVLTLNRAKRRNALSVELVRAIVDAIESRDESIRAILITGAGSAFCAGGDLPDLAGIAEGGPIAVADVIYGNFHRLVRAITGSPVPVIAAVNGPAMGAGLDLAMACDFRIAAEDAVLASSWVNVGLVPGMGGAFLLARAVGGTRAAEILLLGDRIPAQRAEAIGLVNSVVPADQLQKGAEDLAARLAQRPSVALARTKASLRRALDAGLADELATMGATQGGLLTGPDFQAVVDRMLGR
jgi:2-(1,2-epoxy-1,2-dihydrophenyl)acetyl-CoA isomerase